ncbi:MAG: folate-binding protein YgfZ [Gammaproteobacteria bacterium]|nr:folate-binding protein YgfZ [Gammaproteobacteria bacterium]
MKLTDVVPATLSYEVDANGDHSFAAPDTELDIANSESCVCPLTDLALIRVDGADARSFLHAQFVSDVMQVNVTRGQLSAWCTAQGRVSFLFYLWQHADGFLLCVPRSESARLMTRLKMFVLRAQVTLAEVSDVYGVLGLCVPQTARPDWAAGLEVTRYAVSVLAESLSTLCIDDGARFLVCGPIDALAAWWRTHDLAAIGSNTWRLGDIEQGLPVISEINANAFLPQQLNLDTLGALSFNKGCYPGQEIVARMKYRGTVKSRLRRGHTAAMAAPGTPCFRAGESAAHSAGQIISSATLPAGGCTVLVVAELAVTAPLHLGIPDGPTVTLDHPSPISPD